MPITQARLHSLLSAAKALDEAYTGLCRFASSQFGLAVQGLQTPDEALQNIAPFLSPQATVVDYSLHRATIAREDQHYSLTHRQNTRKREHARRRAAGASAHASALREEEIRHALEEWPSWPSPINGTPSLYPTIRQQRSEETARKLVEAEEAEAEEVEAPGSGAEGASPNFTRRTDK